MGQFVGGKRLQLGDFSCRQLAEVAYRYGLISVKADEKAEKGDHVKTPNCDRSAHLFVNVIKGRFSENTR